MKIETGIYLDHARRRLANAVKMLAAEMPDEAADAGYNVYLRIAQAYVFEKNGNVPKNHGDVWKAYDRISREDSRISPGFVAQMRAANRFKNINDYGGMVVLPSLAEAQVILDGARHFLDAVIAVLSDS